MSFDSLLHAQLKLFVAKCNSLNVYVKSEFNSLLASLR